MLKNLLLIVFWGGFIVALLYPFTRLTPIPQFDEEVEWQLPEGVENISRADIQHLSQRLAYTQKMPEFYPLPDFDQITDISEKKRAFFNYLRPYIKRENSRLLSLREQLTDIYEKKRKNIILNRTEKVFVYVLYNEFRMEVEESSLETLAELLKRVDVIPELLVLMQAANESAWGTSRFAVEGYNFFGQWCFREGCGFVPLRRGEDQFHEVARFETPAAAIRSYFYNLNTFPAYEELRDVRVLLREQKKPVTADMLAGGLMRYSERGEEYIQELRQMIRVNRRFVEES